MLDALVNGASISELVEILMPSCSRNRGDTEADQKKWHELVHNVDRPIQVDLEQGLDATLLQRPISPVRAIFMTGATGFLGAHILSCLLRELPNVTVYCLVRCQSKQHGQRRLFTAFATFTLELRDEELARIDVIPGDLEVPLFGLCQERFVSLANDVQRIYHSGAYVNHMTG